MIQSWLINGGPGSAPNTNCRPSDDQAAQQVKPPLDPKKVSCFTSRPSGFMVKTSETVPDALLNAIRPFLPGNVALAGPTRVSAMVVTATSVARLEFSLIKAIAVPIQVNVLDFIFASSNVRVGNRGAGSVEPLRKNW